MHRIPTRFEQAVRHAKSSAKHVARVIGLVGAGLTKIYGRDVEAIPRKRRRCNDLPAEPPIGQTLRFARPFSLQPLALAHGEWSQGCAEHVLWSSAILVKIADVLWCAKFGAYTTKCEAAISNPQALMGSALRTPDLRAPLLSLSGERCRFIRRSSRKPSGLLAQKRFRSLVARRGFLPRL